MSSYPYPPQETAPQPWDAAAQTPAAAFAYAPNYGAFGTVPSDPGVVYFGEKWAARNGGTIMMMVGIGLAALGLIMTIGGAAGLGISSIVVGLIFVLMGMKGRKSDIHMDVICDAQGATVRPFSRKEQNLPVVRIPWAAVSATRCVVTVVTDNSSESGVPRTSYIQEFAVDVTGAQAVQISRKKFKQFDAFIDLCNRSTPHLGYRWVPNHMAKSVPVIEQSLKFSKVPLG